MHDGLTDQNSIERVAVKPGKPCQVKRGFFVKQQGRRRPVGPGVAFTQFDLSEGVLGTRSYSVGTFTQFDLSEGVFALRFLD